MVFPIKGMMIGVGGGGDDDATIDDFELTGDGDNGDDEDELGGVDGDDAYCDDGDTGMVLVGCR